MNKYYKKLFALTGTAIFVIVLVLNLYSFPTGYTGVTKKGDGLGCICHGTNQPTPAVTVFFAGPDSVAVSETVSYKIKIVHGPAIVGGFDAAVYAGTIDTVYSDTTIRRDNSNGDLTHRFPKHFSNDTLTWTFKYTAPGGAQFDTLYAVGNSCNNDTTSSNDQWNFSPNFPIRVYNPIGIKNSNAIVKEFRLEQNYPNPFNPTTKIRFEVQKNSYLTLTVYDISGKIVKILRNGETRAGSYEAEFNAENLSSGVYFYKLAAGSFSETKAMILIK